MSKLDPRVERLLQFILEANAATACPAGQAILAVLWYICSVLTVGRTAAERSSFRRVQHVTGVGFLDCSHHGWDHRRHHWCSRRKLVGLLEGLRGRRRERKELVDIALNWEQRGQPDSLRYADLRRADLRGARLGGDEEGNQGANLSYADLGRANLRRANLSMAELRDVSLNGADLSYADLRGANLEPSGVQPGSVQPEKGQPARCQPDRANLRLPDHSSEDSPIDGSHKALKRNLVQ